MGGPIPNSADRVFSCADPRQDLHPYKMEALSPDLNRQDLVSHSNTLVANQLRIDQIPNRSGTRKNICENAKENNENIAALLQEYIDQDRSTFICPLEEEVPKLRSFMDKPAHTDLHWGMFIPVTEGQGTDEQH